MLLAAEFEPALLKEAHALFTAHRDVRDVLLSLSQAGGCTSTLLQAFSNYSSFLPHVCHDMRYEDLRSAQGGSAREAQRLIGMLGMHVDLMAVVRRIGAWSKARLKQREALAFVTDDPGAHRLFRGELHKLGHASCQNITSQIDQLRSGFGEWLVKERCEAASDPSSQPAPAPAPAPEP